MRARAVALAAALLAAACSGGDGEDVGDTAGQEADEARAALAPEFGPTSSTTATTATSAPPTTIVIGGTDAVADEAVAPSDPVSVIVDPAGDTTAAAGAPAWADILGARLTLSGDYELRIRLGATAPDRAPDSNTMNIATFFDVNGDGALDHEIWVNLGPEGWGASYYDDRTGEARHGENSFVRVAPEGDEVVVRFSTVHLEGDDAFRWSIASEWGPYGAIGSLTMARDEAPDGGTSADFPQG